MNTYKSRKTHVNIIIQTSHKTADVGLSVQPVQFKIGLEQLMTMVMCGFLLKQIQ